MSYSLSACGASSCLLRAALKTRTALSSTPAPLSRLQVLYSASPNANVPCQKRSATTRSRAIRPPPRAPRAVPVSQPNSSGQSRDEVFDLANIPFPVFERAFSMNKEAFNKLSPSDYYDALSKYFEAVKKGANPRSVNLPGDGGVPAPILHDLACILRGMHSSRAAAQCVTSLYASASDQGYQPSTLSLARIVIATGAWGKGGITAKVEKRFKQLVFEGNDSNVLTAEGELLYEQGKYDAAVKVLQRALSLNSANFQWKGLCLLSIGKSLAKLERHSEAVKALEEAHEAGALEADMELGKLLRASDPEKAEQHLYRAALLGKVELCNNLSEIAMERQRNATDEESRKEFGNWALEWSKLADLKTPY